MRFRPPVIIGIAFTGILSSAASNPVDFAHEVVPVLQEYCADCHLDEEKKGGFSMNTRAAILAGSENGEVVVPKNGSASYLIDLLQTDDDEILMPPKGDRVPPEKVAILEQWIDEGMTWEPGFTFAKNAWEPPLSLNDVTLPPSSSSGRDHPIDRILDSYLEERELPSIPPISDSSFARRLYLDVVGILPPREIATKLPSRSDLIDAVLNDDVGYADHWLTFWNDLLRNDYAGTGFIDGGRKQITLWLYNSLRENKPYDQFVRELISPTPESEGFINGIKWRGAVNSSQTQEVQFSQNISQVFLGINMKCASCHDSFIDRWKLEDAYSLAAIVATEPLEIHRCDKPTGRTATAAWIFPELGTVDSSLGKQERLKQLSLLMTDRENGRFSRTIVNRLWHRLMGRGIVHPVDAMETRPWNEDLLDWLAVDFIEHRYDIKHTIRRIVTSSAYQSQSVAQYEDVDTEDYVYQGPIAKRLTAEQFVDAVWELTNQAPRTQQAGVVRFDTTQAADPQSSINAEWIWSPSIDNQAPAAGEKVAFRRKIEVPEGKRLRRATAIATADNSYRIFINNKLIGEGTRWTDVDLYEITHLMKQGVNWVMIAAANGGNTPNAAGALAEIHLHFEDGTIEVIGTDAKWTYVSASPDDRGRFSPAPGKWQWAAPVSAPEVWQKVQPEWLRQATVASSDALPPMVRASLVKSDLLLRSLGRPNREQVVTVRPEDLSTLQAIDLANGEILSSTLRDGAAYLGRTFDKHQNLVDHLYLSALTRFPSREEKKISTEILGDPLSPKSIEDLLWAIIMLPEFQIIR